MSGLPEIEWLQILQHIGHMAVAYLLAFPTAVNQEAQSNSAGVRTFPLVAVATCGYMLIGMSVFEDTEATARMMTGIVTGMGFIGGGAILKSEGRVAGLATAAALWSTGAIGIAVAWTRYEIAVSLAIVNFATLHYLSKPVKQAIMNNGGRNSDDETDQDR